MQLHAICPCFISLQLYMQHTSKHLLLADEEAGEVNKGSITGN